MQKRLLLVGNWKMNLNAAQSKELAGVLLSKGGNLKKSELWVAPSFTSIPALSPLLIGGPVKLGSQNAHGSDKGAFTGEVSVPMLKEFGVSFVIVGHSERRHVFNENDQLVTQRAKGILEQGMPVIFCVGEKLDERERNHTMAVLERQLSALLDAVNEDLLPNVVLAYEPVWAIGTGRVASEADILSAHAHLQKVWTEHVDAELPPILYGGSVSPENFAAIAKLDNVSGALVGGASLVAEKFLELAKIAEES